MTRRDVADANGRGAPYASVNCDKLVEKGFMLRTPHPNDTRRKLVSLSEKGTSTSHLARQFIVEPPQRHTAPSPSDLARLEEFRTRLSTQP